VTSKKAETSGDVRLFTPPSPRDDAALKPVFEVRSLSSALQDVAANGGVVTNRTFRFDGVTRHDVLDPDGNVIQLRCPTKEQVRQSTPER
jgi:predicted enzyme related to lactoylglutathione lyase